MLQSYPQPGSLLAERYRLIRMIGEGGMGVVFEAQNTFTERKVAIKWLNASAASNPEASKRMVREALNTCRVRHPNVIDIYDVIREGDSIFLVMELLEGEPLQDLLLRGGVPLHQLVALLIPAMRGVAEAHRHKVIHRDVHPANIFLARQPNQEQPVPKVLDFGISKMIGEGTPSLTRSGTTMGTPLYMSYEQLCNASDVDERTDVYSFGVILYEALTGRPPFEAESFPELAVKIATMSPVPPKQLRPDIPTALEQLVAWAMQRDREQRLESMDAFIRELSPFASEHAFRAQMTDPERALPAVAARSERASGAPSHTPRTPSHPALAPTHELRITPPVSVVEAAPSLVHAARSPGAAVGAPAAPWSAVPSIVPAAQAPVANPVQTPAPVTSKPARATGPLVALAVGVAAVLALAGGWLFTRIEHAREASSPALPSEPAQPLAAPAPAAFAAPSAPSVVPAQAEAPTSTSPSATESAHAASTAGKRAATQGAAGVDTANVAGSPANREPSAQGATSASAAQPAGRSVSVPSEEALPRGMSAASASSEAERSSSEARSPTAAARGKPSTNASALKPSPAPAAPKKDERGYRAGPARPEDF